MSAAAIPIYNMLLAKGVDEKDAREAAEAIAAVAIAEARQVAGIRAKEVAAGTAAETEEKADAKFVSKDEYHARDRTLATRDDLHREISGVRGELSDIRKDIRFIQYTLIGGLAAFAGALAAIIAKLFFGV